MNSPITQATIVVAIKKTRNEIRILEALIRITVEITRDGRTICKQIRNRDSCPCIAETEGVPRNVC